MDLSGHTGGIWAIAAVIVGGIGGIFVRLFVRVRTIERDRKAADVRLENLEKDSTSAGELRAIRKELHDMRLCMVGNYISREDFVPMASKVLGALERQGAMVARLEGRLDARAEGGRHAD